MDFDLDYLIPGKTIGYIEKKSVVNFLSMHLDEYGDSEESIDKAIDYAVNPGLKPGGFVLVAKLKGEIMGAVVINKTGMQGYIPENILVYIAVHKDARGMGLGKLLMKEVIAKTEGNIALHVEHNNPAKYLYEKMGFTNPYLEMRLDKSKITKQ